MGLNECYKLFWIHCITCVDQKKKTTAISIYNSKETEKEVKSRGAGSLVPRLLYSESIDLSCIRIEYQPIKIL